jgi:hypothetical protein
MTWRGRRHPRVKSLVRLDSALKGDRWFRPQGPAFAVALLALIIAGSTVGYVAIEGWSVWDAFYMTIITVTTVGYREVHVLSRAGEVLTVVVLVSGVGAALYGFTLLATVVVEGGLPKRLQRRRHERMLETIKDHFIICGYGRIGSIVAHQFRRQHVPYVVVERNPERLQAALEDGALGVEADASREEVLTRVGIDRARGLIAAIGTDARTLRRAQRAGDAAGSLHHQPRRDGGRADQAEAGRRRPRALALSDRRRADRADGAAAGGGRLRGAGDERRQPRAGDGGDHDRAGIGAGGRVDPRSEPAPALRRHRRRHSTAG